MITQTFPSASSAAVYTAQVDPTTGEGSCTCPAWRFVKPGQPRGCKHTRQLASNATMRTETAEALKPAHAMVEHASRPPVEHAPRVMPGTVKPMLASAMTRGTFADYARDGWLLEEKFDGHRVLVNKAADGTITAWSRPRAGKEALMRALPAHLITALRFLPEGTYDGELVSPGGKSWDVARLDTRAGQVLVLFDVIEVWGTNVTHEPYTKRREVLTLCLRHQPLLGDSALIMPEAQPVTLDAVQAIWTRGGEGAILKRTASTYQPGRRSEDWIKVKRAGSAVGVITGYKAGKSGPYSTVLLRLDDGTETAVKTKDNATLAMFTHAPGAYIGRRLVIAYTETTPDGKPRHGIFDHLAGAGE